MYDAPQATGMAVVEELQRQREHMESSQRRVKEMDESLSSAERLLTKMSTWWRGM